MEIKSFIKLFIPPIIFKFYNLCYRKSKYGWFGNYKSWSEAKVDCSGYDSELILESVSKATLKVLNGEALFERDSVLFNKIDYSYPILSALMWIAVKNSGKLNLIDFGGSLGSIFYQNRFFLSCLEKVEWNIIEQSHYVNCGKKIIKDDKLIFFNSIKECLDHYNTKESKPKVILLSSVLQYIEKPYELLDEIIDFGFDFVIFDRTSFNIDKIDRLTIQKVPDEIYKASYPSWFLNEQSLIQSFDSKYDLIYTFFSTIPGEQVYKIDNKPLGYGKGFLFMLKHV